MILVKQLQYTVFIGLRNTNRSVHFAIPSIAVINDIRLIDRVHAKASLAHSSKLKASVQKNERLFFRRIVLFIESITFRFLFLRCFKMASRKTLSLAPFSLTCRNMRSYYLFSYLNDFDQHCLFCGLPCLYIYRFIYFRTIQLCDLVYKCMYVGERNRISMCELI